MTARAFRKSDGTEIRPGDQVTNFRGETHTFHAVTRPADGHRSAKIQLDGPNGGEVYASVIPDLVVRTLNEGTEAIYVFDVAAVVTITVRTSAGEDAARRAADALDEITVRATRDDLNLSADVAPDVVFDVRTVAPRGRAYLVDAHVAGSGELEISAQEIIPELITGDHRADLAEVLADAVTALEGDSNDAEHDALYGLAEVVADTIGTEFDPHAPHDGS